MTLAAKNLGIRTTRCKDIVTLVGITDSILGLHVCIY